MAGDEGVTLQTLQPEIRRDHFKRPYIKQADGREQTYTRTTTFVGAFEDTYMLEQWKMRQAAIGLSLRSDLQLAVVAHRDDSKRLNEICKEALEVAEASAKATTGTAMHAIAEQHDRGQEIVGLPVDAATDLAAYAAATLDLEPVLIEQMTVYDEWKVAGTPDRVVRYRGGLYIGDLKFGKIELGAGKIAAQLAMYARGKVYDIGTGERTEHNASLDKGIVIHLPAGTGVCELKWVDLRAGWEIAKTCLDVRDKRRLSASQLYTPLDGKSDRTLHQVLAGPAMVTPTVAGQITVAISEATSRDSILSLWGQAVVDGQWTERHTELAKARVAELEAS